MSIAIATKPASWIRRAFFTRPDVSLECAWRIWRRNATIYRRTYKMNILPNFFEPFFYLLAMGFGLGAYLTEIRGVDYVDFIAPGLAMTAALYGSTFETTFNVFVKLNYGRIYDGVAATPVTPEDAALGEILWATTRALIYGVIFVLVSIPFGVAHSWLVVFMPIAIGLTGLLFGIIGLIYTLVIPIIDYFSYFWSMFITPMFLFGGTFFPLERLPGWLETVAWFVPLRHSVDMARALMLTGDAEKAITSGIWLLVACAVLLVLPLNLMRMKLVR